MLDDIAAETLADVVRKHKKQLAKGTIGPGKVIADLMLGTWVMLVEPGRNLSTRSCHRLRDEPLATGAALRLRDRHLDPGRATPATNARRRPSPGLEPAASP